MPKTRDTQVVDLVNAFASFQHAHRGADIDAFCRHRLSAEAPAAPPLEDGLPLEAHMGRVFGHLSRMANLYAKKVLPPLGLANLEDFGYLATLSRMDAPRKGELIRAMHSETTSGTSVLKRLVQQGWVRELPDPHDGRSQRVHVTPKGHRALAKCFPRMAEVGRMMFGVLDPKERTTLFTLLRKIEAPHAKLLIARRDDSFDELMADLYGPVPHHV